MKEEKEKGEKRKNKKLRRAILVFLAIIDIVLLSWFIYDRATINNEYSVAEQNIEIPIFVYHNIVNDKSEIEYDYMQTDKDTFESQIKWLLEYGYNFITYKDLQKFKNNQIKLKKHSCILTFDDGFEGVYEYAYPIAKKYNIPFTMYLITDLVDEEGRITWQQAEEMQNSGLVALASHSTDHVDFTTLTAQEAVNNVNESYRIIEANLGKQDLKIFTYPYGLYTEEQVIELEKNGYIQNLTDNKINKSHKLNMSKLHRCYPLSDSKNKILLKILFRSLKYDD